MKSVGAITSFLWQLPYFFNAGFWSGPGELARAKTLGAFGCSCHDSKMEETAELGSRLARQLDQFKAGWRMLSMLQPWSYPMILKHYKLQNKLHRSKGQWDRSTGYLMRTAPRHRNFVQRPGSDLDPMGLMKARLAVQTRSIEINSMDLNFVPSATIFIRFRWVWYFWSICHVVKTIVHHPPNHYR